MWCCSVVYVFPGMLIVRSVQGRVRFTPSSADEGASLSHPRPSIGKFAGIFCTKEKEKITKRVCR